MATSEADFKSGFRGDLRRHYTGSLVWTNTDMFRVGLPDFSVSWNKGFWAVEAKFIKKLPKKPGSKCLNHEVSAMQCDFLKQNRVNGNGSAILIGMPDVAVVMSEIKENYTLEELMAARRVSRKCGAWNVTGFLEMVGGFNEQR